MSSKPAGSTDFQYIWSNFQCPIYIFMSHQSLECTNATMSCSFVDSFCFIKLHLDPTNLGMVINYSTFCERKKQCEISASVLSH